MYNIKLADWVLPEIRAAAVSYVKGVDYCEHEESPALHMAYDSIIVTTNQDTRQGEIKFMLGDKMVATSRLLGFDAEPGTVLRIPCEGKIPFDLTLD